MAHSNNQSCIENAPETAEPRLRIAISSCLLGERVRYDGGHKQDRFITDTLGKVFQWVPVCPETEAGFGIPREAMRLESMGQTRQRIRLLGITSRRDLTQTMNDFAGSRVEPLAGEQISGCILKSKSPSCGLFKVRIYRKGAPAKAGRGLFAEALLSRLPDLPVEEEERLHDPQLRENWVERVFAYYRLNRLWDSRWTVSDLQSFHARHKLTLMSHSPQRSRLLGQLVARAGDLPKQALRTQYQAWFMSILAVPATRSKHCNALQHAAGYLKKLLDPNSRSELHDQISDYRSGIVPLAVPLTLICRHLRGLNIPYLACQTYLNPSPNELSLQSRV